MHCLPRLSTLTTRPGGDRLLAACLGVLMLLIGMLGPRYALATTVAVLPLTKGSASESYDGLGKALAGMLVSDLTAADSLRLVERERLDALMGELSLSETGFLDAATAQQLGRGLGAQVVLTGSFSVVDAAFLLDARLVEVESGEILKAADSQGGINDFVAVEKDLVEQLLAGLDVALDAAARRKVMVQTPTEQWGAFTAWGEGLARRDEGDLEGARVAFERALATDPAFAQARAELLALQGLLEAARSEQRLVADALLDGRFRAALAQTVDERDRPRNFRHDATSLAELMLRQGVLHDAGLHCQRVEELRAYLDRVAWQLPALDHHTQLALRDRTQALELDQEDTWDARRRVGLPTRNHPAELFEHTTSLVMHGRAMYLGRTGMGLVDSLRQCLDGEAYLAELDALHAAARAAGAADRVDGRFTPLSLGEHLDLLWAWTRARQQGADAALNQRTQALLAGARDEDHRDALLSSLDNVLREADQTSAYQAGTLGETEERLTAVMQALSDQDQDAFLLDSPACRWIFENQLGVARAWVVRLDGYLKETDEARRHPTLRLHYQMAGHTVGPFQALGCLPDRTARVRSFADAVQVLSGVSLSEGKENDGSCVQLQSNLTRSLNQPTATPEYFAQAPMLEGAMTWGALSMYYALVSQRCVPLPDAR